MPDCPVWLSGGPGKWSLLIRVQPGARVCEANGEHGDAIRIKVAAPPVDGKANEALLGWLSQRLDVPLRAVELASGAASRVKRVVVMSDLPADQLVQRLLTPPR